MQRLYVQEITSGMKRRKGRKKWKKVKQLDKLGNTDVKISWTL